ncbi:response regulator transcription factor [Campylobacter majalis]|uniref:response regulator transcription factor n=1 Tax=Campylobacter majalis TaxID=2790656 RepID=UPI003D68B64F
MKILIIEDEIDLNDIIAKHLKKGGYNVDCAYNGVEGLEYIDVATYDAIVLDVMMPIMDGFSFLSKLRSKNDKTPVLMLTAKSDKQDIVNALDMGADDYLSKPFDIDELKARLRSIIRRSNHKSNNEILAHGLTLNMAQKSVKYDDILIDLTAKEYEILEILMLNQDKIVSKEMIKESIYDFSNESSSNVLEVLVKNIRKKLENAGLSDFIQTRRNQGYVIKA